MKTKTFTQHILLKNKVENTVTLTRMITINPDLSVEVGEFFEGGLRGLDSAYIVRLFANHTFVIGHCYDLQWFEEVPTIFEGHSLRDINTFEVVDLYLNEF